MISQAYLTYMKMFSVYGNKRIMASLTCAFRYGREDLDVLGLTFRKELYAGQIYTDYLSLETIIKIQN